MGSLAAGGAAATGTGAFTSVEADRTISVSTAGDADAMLAIKPAKSGSSETPNAAEYVDDTGDTVSLDFTGVDHNGDDTDEATGINKNSETKFANLLDIENRGTQDVLVGADDDNGFISTIDGGIFAEGREPSGVDNPNYPDPDHDDDTDPGAGFSMPDDPVRLAPGQQVQNIGLDINDPSTIPSGGEATLIIQAYSVDAYEQNFSGSAPTNS